MLEVEIKVKVNLHQIETALSELGFLKASAVYEYDIYYNSKLMDLKKEDKALRIRKHKDLDSDESCYIMNFKGPKLDNQTMTREETQFYLPCFESAETMLKGLGFFHAGEVEKTRIHYVKDNIKCCLDNVTGLGEYLEIEIMTEKDGYENALSEIKGLLGKLSLSMENTVRESYLSMLKF